MSKSNNPIRFGIIGCAVIARKVSRAINLAPNATLYAIGSRSIEKAKKFAADNGFCETVKMYGSYNEVLDDPCVDAVYVPLPTSLHVQWAVMAAEKKKHVLLEKPTALNLADLEHILKACDSNGVQFMDGTMWLHHPRTAKMREMLSDAQLFGQLKSMYSSSTFSETLEFFENNIRVKPDLDALGALGDTGWYCIGAILWAANYKLPNTVMALPAANLNAAGVILACGCSFHWAGEDSKVATFHCSFLSHESMDLALYGSNGSLHLKDFIIPYQESSASFDFVSGAKFKELHIGWNLKPTKVQVFLELPQETLMVQEFARLVNIIKNSAGHPDSKWPEISRKTQLVMDAVKKSIELGFKPIDL
ncbi:PREDICTED: uncharacterized oxidoreductase At4g09670-like [Nelumbo nucifera]|uniref:Gfo/Idh/MocA-like oxidoreductase N-terminal domain-containing protein n=2 Tax=Nelumbo nucifera TaxID=4432 RepID=A0A822YLY1_NELNU|nr:PREDICTED: uncharacterized oxidoreductase At4g09670-like [Nelumbo nucifera]DAD32309.1 TPA_asm: hypothetical protein HUJ06_011160 [Nelumbo nucifera]